MNSKMVLLLIAVFLSSCALNNEMVIESKQKYQSNFNVEGFEFRFPPPSNIHIERMHGATWLISGDLSDIFRNVVANIDPSKFDGMDNISGSYMDIEAINLRYQDEMPGGPDTLLSVGLKIRFTGKYDGVSINHCQISEVIPPYPPPVSHGVFVSREKLRPRIQPVYEKLIEDALSKAVLLGLNCLSRESKAASSE